MIDENFIPHVDVYHERGKPMPLLPIDYSPFKMIKLPRGLGRRPLSTQLAVVKRAVGKMAKRYPSSPFGAVHGYEFEWRRNVSIFLNSEGEFASDPEPNKRAKDRDRRKARPKSTDEPTEKREYVIGFRDAGFCSLVAEGGAQADDQDLTFARRFLSLSEAQAAAEEEVANVFEIVNKDGQEELREIMVDLEVAETKPFRGCYRLTERLWVGPSFRTESATETDGRLRALAALGVSCIVSLIDPADVFLIQGLTDLLARGGVFSRPNFEHSFFPVSNGEAPSKRHTKIVLDVIDAACLERRLTYVHCTGGRGKASCVAAAWIARHGVANGQAALDELMKLRFACGIFTDSPETEEQRRLVREWKKGD